MSNMRGVGLAACLLGLLLADCSRPPPPVLATPTVTPTVSNKTADADKTNSHSKRRGKDQKAPEDTMQAYKSAINACRDEASKKTMGSILAILSRLRPGAYNANYAACMKSKGFVVSE
jgi:hypothetical protein